MSKAKKIMFARSQGVGMGSRYNGSVFGWTTDEAAAAACREEGLRVMSGYNKTGPVGWEITATTDLDDAA